MVGKVRIRTFIDRIEVIMDDELDGWAGREGEEWGCSNEVEYV